MRLSRQELEEDYFYHANVRMFLKYSEKGVLVLALKRFADEE